MPSASSLIKGNGQAQQKLVEEGREILLDVAIDPIFGAKNLVCAPNGVKDQHNIHVLT